MIRNLTTLVAFGLFGSLLLAGNAEACHKLGCKKSCAAPAPCVAPAPVCAPACAPVAKKICMPRIKLCAMPKICAPRTCAPKVRSCGFHLPKLCLKKKCAAPAEMACAGPVCPVPSPQASAQH